MKKFYVATVRLAVIADSDVEAEDAVSAMLTGNLQQSGALLDWAYTEDKKERLGFSVPQYGGMVDENNYEEYSFAQIQAINDFAKSKPGFKLVSTEEGTFLIKRAKKFKKGQRVFWLDPAGETSQVNTIVEPSKEMVFLSEPGGSEIEALPNEVYEIVAQMSKPNQVVS